MGSSAAAFRLVCPRTGAILAERAAVARTPIQRLVGLLAYARLEPGEGLIFGRCNSIHTWFMRFPIDVVFVDGRRTVVRVYNSLPPWRMTPLVWQAATVIELPAGTGQRTQLAIGDEVVFEPDGR